MDCQWYHSHNQINLPQLCMYINNTIWMVTQKEGVIHIHTYCSVICDLLKANIYKVSKNM